MLPTIDAHGNKQETLVYSAITSMDDAKNVNWENLLNYPNPEQAIKSNFASEFNVLIQN